MGNADINKDQVPSISIVEWRSRCICADILMEKVSACNVYNYSLAYQLLHLINYSTLKCEQTDLHNYMPFCIHCSLDDSSIYYLSSLPCGTYDLLEKVFSMLAEGRIKRQNNYCPRGSMGKK